MPSPTSACLTAADAYPSDKPTTDLDHARYDRDGWMESALRAQGYVGELQGRLAAALARAERAEKALEPFADFVSTLEQQVGDARPVVIGGYGRHRKMLTAGDVRRAAAALAQPAPDEET